MDNTGITIITPKGSYQDFPISFDIPIWSILFFSADDELSHLVQENYEDLLVKFNELEFNFTIVRSDAEFLGIGKDRLLQIYDVLEYKYPRIKNFYCSFNEWYFEESCFSASKLKLFLSSFENVPENWHSGFYFNGWEESFYPETSYSGNYPEYINTYLTYLKGKKEELYKSEGIKWAQLSPNFERPDDKIEIDEEAFLKINLIEKNLEDLKQSGDISLIIPILQKYIDETEDDLTEYDFFSLSISIDDYKILIPEIDVEIKLNTLTKAIYFLFLSADSNGIDIKNLAPHKEYLLKIYKTISNRYDIEKLEETVDSLVAPGSELIYMHLSRIKSAFCEQIDDNYASWFYVQGTKGKNKFIPSRTREYSNIKKFFKIWGFPSHIKE